MRVVVDVRSTTLPVLFSRRGFIAIFSITYSSPSENSSFLDRLRRKKKNKEKDEGRPREEL